MSSTYQVKTPPILTELMAKRLAETLKRIKNQYVSRTLPKKRAVEEGVDAINNHYTRCIQVVRDDMRYRFRSIEEPTKQQMKPLEQMRRDAVKEWRAIMNDVHA